jgi:predicted nucleic acid-binding protein
LNGRFPEPPLAIESADYADLTSALAAGRMRGGEVYDALIAATAKSAGAVLLTRDRRAEATYRAIGVESRYLN